MHWKCEKIMFLNAQDILDGSKEISMIQWKNIHRGSWKEYQNHSNNNWSILSIKQVKT